MIATHSRKPPDRMPTVEIVPLSSDRDFPEVLLIADASFSNPGHGTCLFARSNVQMGPAH